MRNNNLPVRCQNIIGAPKKVLQELSVYFQPISRVRKVEDNCVEQLIREFTLEFPCIYTGCNTDAQLVQLFDIVQVGLESSPRSP